MGRGFYRMWRPIGNTSFLQFPAVGSAAELGETIIDYVMLLYEEDEKDEEEEEEEDPFFDPYAVLRNQKSFPDIAQAMSILANSDISGQSTVLSPVPDVSVGNQVDPVSTLMFTLIGWIIGIAFSWIPCLVLWLIVDGYCCGWCCGQCCMGCARCCNCCCRCCRNRKPILTCGCYDRNGPKKCWIYVSKIIWTVLTAGYIFGGVVATVAAFTIPTFLSKISGIFSGISQVVPTLASRAMPPLVTTLPTALAPLSTVASDLDSDTLPLLNAWDILFRVDEMLLIDYFPSLRSPHWDSEFTSDVANISELTALQGFTFTADVVPCDTFEGEVTLTNIQVTDTIRSTLTSQFFDFDHLEHLLTYRYGNDDYPEKVPQAVDDIRFLNSYLGSASHASHVASAKSLLSTFKTNVFSHPILDEIMSEFEQVYQQSLTYTRTPDPSQCFTDLEDFKNSFASVVPGPAAYTTILDALNRIIALARNLAYDTPWSRRELAKTMKTQIVPGNNGTSATFTLISDDELNQIPVITDPSNFISFTSSSCNSFKYNLQNLHNQNGDGYHHVDIHFFKNLLDRNFRFADHYGTENKTKTMLNDVLGDVEFQLSLFSLGTVAGDLEMIIPSAALSIVGTVVQSLGYTLAGFQLTLILVYVLMIVLNWTCANDTCLCCQNLTNFFYYIIFGLIFLFFALLAILLQDIQDAIYSDKDGLGLVPLMETSGFADKLLSLGDLEGAGYSPDLILQSIIYVTQGPTYRSKEKDGTELPNPLGELLDVLLLRGMTADGVDGSLEKLFVVEKGVVSPTFKAKLAPIEEELHTKLESFFASVCDETDLEKGVFTYNFLARPVYELVDVIGLDMVNVLMMFYFAFNLAFILFIPQTVCTSVGRTHWPPYERERDDPDYAEEWNEEDRAEGKELPTPANAQVQQQQPQQPAPAQFQPEYQQQPNPNEQYGQPVWDGYQWVQPQAQTYPQQPYWDGQQWVQPQQGGDYWQQGQPVQQANGDWSGQPQQTQEIGEADKGPVGAGDQPVATTERDVEMEAMERPHQGEGEDGNASV
ncbi:hypothetical protein BLNAU_13854 [Blattamonas nauphoetae]|uniref:Uncharacterized protein n=1 Tax=Blattamonas nauphoetae TaxID=2049346 RepID=A0ABQ9XFK3_9EUKA|nr:hypothetical protein BLNAU_13854 [Blattamonas nauphoetae]